MATQIGELLISATHRDETDRRSDRTGVDTFARLRRLEEAAQLLDRRAIGEIGFTKARIPDFRYRRLGWSRTGRRRPGSCNGEKLAPYPIEIGLQL